MTPPARPLGITALSLFFAFGALMSGLTVFLLLFPGTVLDSVWRLNPRAHEGFATMGSWTVLLMAVVCLGCVVAAVGLWRCTRWGLWTALTILSVNLAGDTTNAIVTGDKRTLIGLPIGGLMIWYLLRKRRLFGT
jgi:uncharacterized membrane protein (DUF2068 family)